MSIAPGDGVSASDELSLRRQVHSDEYPALVDVWRSAVDATHDFLRHEDRDVIQAQLASNFLPNVNLVVAEHNSDVVGFAGVVDDKLEMLFVSAPNRGSGVGRALLTNVIDVDGVRFVDVNEDNLQAVRFYRRWGFEVIERCDVDDVGRPYPLLRMKHAGSVDGGDLAPRVGV